MSVQTPQLAQEEGFDGTNWFLTKGQLAQFDSDGRFGTIATPEGDVFLPNSVVRQMVHPTDQGRHDRGGSNLAHA